MSSKRQDNQIGTHVGPILVMGMSLVMVWMMLESSVFAKSTIVEPDKVPAMETIENPKSEEPKSTALPVPFDEFDRGNPRASVEGFLAAGNEGHYERAAEYLDFRYLPGNIIQQPRPSLTRQFKVVLDRALWIDLAELSRDPNGQEGDGLPPYRDLLATSTWENKRSTFSSSMYRVKTEYSFGNFPTPPSPKFPACIKNTDIDILGNFSQMPSSILNF